MSIENKLSELLGTMQAGGGNMDATTLMALMSKNGLGGDNMIVFLVLFLLLGRGNLLGGDTNTANAVEGQIEAAINKASANAASFDAIKDAVTNNGADIRQLAQTLNCDFNALTGAISDVKTMLGSIAADINCSTDKIIGYIGQNGEKVINALVNTKCDIVTAVKDCCCGLSELISKGFSDLALRDQANTSALQLAISNLTSKVESEALETRQVVKDAAATAEYNRVTRENDELRAKANRSELLADLTAALKK